LAESAHRYQPAIVSDLQNSMGLYVRKIRLTTHLCNGMVTYYE
jgi:hypothetical protein